jgi:hypothetical protein
MNSKNTLSFEKIAKYLNEQNSVVEDKPSKSDIIRAALNDLFLNNNDYLATVVNKTKNISLEEANAGDILGLNFIFQNPITGENKSFNVVNASEDSIFRPELLVDILKEGRRLSLTFVEDYVSSFTKRIEALNILDEIMKYSLPLEGNQTVLSSLQFMNIGGNYTYVLVYHENLNKGVNMFAQRNGMNFGKNLNLALPVAAALYDKVSISNDFIDISKAVIPKI